MAQDAHELHEQGPGPTAEQTSELAAELRSLVARLRRRLREQATGGDFTPSQAAALIRLERDGPATVSELARAESVRSQSMGATVAPLIEAGLVSSSPHPTDGRQTLLSLSDSARQRFSAARSAKEDWLFRTIRDTLTPDEQRQLATGVQLLKRIADA